MAALAHPPLPPQLLLACTSCLLAAAPFLLCSCFPPSFGLWLLADCGAAGYAHKLAGCAHKRAPCWAALAASAPWLLLAALPHPPADAPAWFPTCLLPLSCLSNGLLLQMEVVGRFGDSNPAPTTADCSLNANY